MNDETYRWLELQAQRRERLARAAPERPGGDASSAGAGATSHRLSIRTRLQRWTRRVSVASARGRRTPAARGVSP